jgi:hypothetical protein
MIGTYSWNVTKYFKEQGRMVLDKQLLAILLKGGMLWL